MADLPRAFSPAMLAEYARRGIDPLKDLTERSERVLAERYGVAPSAEWPKEDHIAAGADTDAPPLRFSKTLAAGELILYADRAEVLRITADGRVRWSGEQTEAALGFWRCVEQLLPDFLHAIAERQGAHHG